MDEFSQLQKKQNQMFVLVLVNFLLFMVLFTGLGYVTWQSISLVNRLKGDLAKTEEAVVNLQTKLRSVDTDVLVNNLVEKTTEKLTASIENVVANADLISPMKKVSEKIDNTQQTLIETGAAIQEVSSAVKGLDNEEIARRVSYNILKGLGDGFQEAAESRKPDTLLKQ